MDSDKLGRTLAKVVDLFVEGKYDELQQLCKGRTPPVEEMKKAVETYGAHLIAPPSDKAEDLVDRGYVKVTGQVPSRWAVDANLWTSEEGLSDLKLILWLDDSPTDYYDIHLLDVHVL